MYKELSPETDEFFHFMTEKNLIDLEAKTAKNQAGIVLLSIIMIHLSYSLISMEHQVISMY